MMNLRLIDIIGLLTIMYIIIVGVDIEKQREPHLSMQLFGEE